MLNVLWVLLQQSFESTNSVHEALGVVQPVDAQQQLLLLIVLDHLRRLLCKADEPVVGNADRQRVHRHRAPVVFHQHLLAVHTAAQTPLAAVDEIEAVILHVEAHGVAAEDPLQELVVPGEEPHDVPRWEGDVQEERHLDGQAQLVAPVADAVGGHHQVVIVEPNKWYAVRVCLRQFDNCLDRQLCKMLVDLPVSLECEDEFCYREAASFCNNLFGYTNSIRFHNINNHECPNKF